MSPEIEAIIQRSLDTIEENLRTEITAQELCDEAGFSLYHYYRLFESAMGMSVGRYMTRRKLVHAIYRMSLGMYAADAALEYGFGTYAGFYRAFRHEFGCAPSNYLRTHTAARPVRICLKEEIQRMNRNQIRSALAAWGMETAAVSNVYYRNTGHASENTFSVGTDLFLKCSARLGALHRQAQLHQALVQQELAAAIVPALDGRTVVQLEDVDFMLVQRASGEPVDARRLMKKPTQASAVGEGIARLHAALQKCEPLLCSEENLLETLKNWAVPVVKKEMGFVRYLDEYLQRISASFPLLPAQIVHRDPNPDNILMANGCVSCFLDFELSRILPRIFDLAYAATAILSNTFDDCEPRAFFQTALALWSGYDSCSPLTTEEKKTLPDMVIAIQLICVAAFSGKETLAKLAQTNQQILKMLIENEDQLQAVAL